MKRSNQLLVTAIPVLLLGVQVGGVGAQEPSNSIAVALVSEALHTLGADSTVSVLRTMRLTGNGTRSWFGQGSSPLNPTLVMPWNVEWIVDFENQRSFRRQVTFRGPDAYFCIWTTYRPDAVFSFECITRILFPADPQSLQQRHATAMKIHPQPRAVLAEALRESETLRYEGVRNVGSDARLHIVSFANAQQRCRTLYIDAGTKLLTRVEDERVQLPLGSVIPLEEYGDYRRVHDIWVPFLFRRVRPLQNSVGMVITDEERYIEVEFNAAADEAVFAVPEPHFPRRPDSEVTITEVAEGVYFIENATPNYNQLAVEFSEYLLVVDAPSNTEVSRTVID